MERQSRRTILGVECMGRLKRGFLHNSVLLRRNYAPLLMERVGELKSMSFVGICLALLFVTKPVRKQRVEVT